MLNILTTYCCFAVIIAVEWTLGALSEDFLPPVPGRACQPSIHHGRSVPRSPQQYYTCSPHDGSVHVWKKHSCKPTEVYVNKVQKCKQRSMVKRQESLCRSHPNAPPCLQNQCPPPISPNVAPGAPCDWVDAPLEPYATNPNYFLQCNPTSLSPGGCGAWNQMKCSNGTAFHMFVQICVTVAISQASCPLGQIAMFPCGTNSWCPLGATCQDGVCCQSAQPPGPPPPGGEPGPGGLPYGFPTPPPPTLYPTGMPPQQQFTTALTQPPHPTIYPQPQPQPQQIGGGYPPQKLGGEYPQQPGSGYPQQPGSGYPQQTGGGYPQQPGGGYPQQTGSGYPQQPGGSYPQQPMIKYQPQPGGVYPPQQPGGYPQQTGGGGYPPQQGVYFPQPPSPPAYPKPLQPSQPGYPPPRGYPQPLPPGYPNPSQPGYPQPYQPGYPQQQISQQQQLVGGGVYPQQPSGVGQPIYPPGPPSGQPGGPGPSWPGGVYPTHPLYPGQPMPPAPGYPQPLTQPPITLHPPSVTPGPYEPYPYFTTPRNLPFCPDGRLANTLCKDNYDCSDGQFCSNGGCCALNKCPNGSPAASFCRELSDCLPTQFCYNNGCCAVQTCPNGEMPKRSCDDRNPCPPSLTCHNGACCPSPLPDCPGGEKSVMPCSGPGTCPPSYFCHTDKSGYKHGCCSIPKCPNGVPAVQPCGADYGCPNGLQCLNNACCEVPTTVGPQTYPATTPGYPQPPIQPYPINPPVTLSPPYPPPYPSPYVLPPPNIYPPQIQTSQQPCVNCCPRFQVAICYCANMNLCPQMTTCGHQGACCAPRDALPYYSGKRPGDRCYSDHECPGFETKSSACSPDGFCVCRPGATSNGFACVPNPQPGFPRPYRYGRRRRPNWHSRRAVRDLSTLENMEEGSKNNHHRNSSSERIKLNNKRNENTNNNHHHHMENEEENFDDLLFEENQLIYWRTFRTANCITDNECIPDMVCLAGKCQEIITALYEDCDNDEQCNKSTPHSVCVSDPGHNMWFSNNQSVTINSKICQCDADFYEYKHTCWKICPNNTEPLERRCVEGSKVSRKVASIENRSGKNSTEIQRNNMQ